MVPGQSGPQAGPGMAQFPGSGLPGPGGVPNQEAMAVQAAEAMRDFLKKEIKSELSRQIAPLNEKLSELLISYLQQRSRDR